MASFKEIKPNFQELARSYILGWNIQFPLDLWWRKKYKVAFASKEHKETNWFDIYLEYVEFKLLTSDEESGTHNITMDEETMPNKEFVAEAFGNMADFLDNINNKEKTE
jgi:hypothetical protein